MTASTPDPHRSGGVPGRLGGPRREPWLPRLTWWGHTWRWLAMIATSMVTFGYSVEQLAPEHNGSLVLDLLVGLVSFAVVCARRRFPLLVAVLLTLAGTVSAFSAGPGILALVSLATRRRWPEVVGVGLLSVVAGQVWEKTNPAGGVDPWWLTLSFSTVMVAALLMAAMYAGSRRELLWSLRERVERAEAEQSLRVEQARTTERERIAREMHDVLGHRISLVSMHAGALSYRTDLDRSQVADSARVIMDNAQLAMSDLRSVLGVLRGGDAAVRGERPQPVLCDLPDLVAEARASGTHVELELAVDGAVPVPDAVGRTVYRVVQEGLTNVRKHAPGMPAPVQVRGDVASGVRVRVENPVPAGAGREVSRPGYGMVGLAERAELSGGTLGHARDGDRFILEAWLPWTT